MKLITATIISITFLTYSFSCKGQTTGTIFPVEKFAVMSAKLSNGKPAVGSFNRGYKDFDKKEAYTWCLTINIGLDLKHVTKNGLPFQSESDICNRFEDELMNNIRKLATAHYIGHLYNDSFLDIYVYLDEPEKVYQFLKKEVDEKGRARDFAFEIKQDPNCYTIKPFLK
ncbi:DUF695 domain-containing protein [Mucilaginibacter gilvus]|uniref:DUF695 domain-containing protein n=1 Tax=Mucilaginibacter gilvus TaxID=2305909 RepID=A0A3S3XFD5_9SPHI|nr:DUF695 domain-containing protein [Mucilaginibacter gilvus]RWY57261.1 DUF695 domain-containing protein [Mucilaginibacter gilvus]